MGGGPNRGGNRGANGAGNATIISTSDMVSQRGENQKAVDLTLAVMRDVNKQYDYAINNLLTAKLGPNDQGVLAYYDSNANLAVNENYFNEDGMNRAYDDSVKTGYHPSRGNKTGLEAVVAHEAGHAISDRVAEVLGIKDTIGNAKIDIASRRIVEEARKLHGKHRGVIQFGSAISGYAKSSNAETVAEAFADYYCNGQKARPESQAVIKVINGYLKKGK